MDSLECNNKQCPDPRGHAGKLFQCKQCQGAIYCSRDCQMVDWKRVHSTSCLSPAGIKGMIAIPSLQVKQTTGQQRLLNKGAQLVSFDGKERGNELDVVIAYLTRNPPPLDDFFSGVKSSLERIRESALMARIVTTERLDVVMKEWATLNGFGNEGGTQALLVRWKIERSKTPGGADVPADQMVVYLVQKGAALSSVIEACEAKLDHGIRLGSDRKPTKAIEGLRREWLQELVKVLVELRDQVIGLESVKNQIGAFVQKQLLYQTRGGFLNFGIFGNPGTGKTEIASRLREILYRLGFTPLRGSDAKFTKADFVAPFEGQTAHLTRITMLRGLGNLMVVDEAYQLVNSPSDSYGKEALTQIVNDLDEYRGMVSVVLVGYEDRIRESLFASNPGLMRRISDIWILQPYTTDEMWRLLLYYLLKVERYNPFTVGMETKYREQDAMDTLDALHKAGLFLNSNAGAISGIIEEYRSVYAQMVFSTSNPKKQALLAARKNDLDYDVMVYALARYGVKSGYNVWNVPDVDQMELPHQQEGKESERNDSSVSEEQHTTPKMMTASSRRRQ